MKLLDKIKSDHAGQNRFERYNIANHESDPEKTGLLPSGLDYEFGTASVKRNENISLFGSSCHTNERLFLKLKWRPSKEESGGKLPLVTLISHLEFTTSDGRTFTYEHIETYRPDLLDHAVGEWGNERPIINQYGSSGAQLKLRILNPYRRLRLIFNGHMQQVGAPDELAFVRLGCVLEPVGQIFDFFTSASKFADARSNWKKVDCLSKIVSEKRHASLHDRHEQKVRFDGEYSLQLASKDDQESPPIEKSQFSLRGFHVRHLLDLNIATPNKQLETTRLYVCLQNGKSFQVGSTWEENNQNGASTNGTQAANGTTASDANGTEAASSKKIGLLRFGYAHFTLHPTCESLSDFDMPIFERISDRKQLIDANEPLVVCSRQQGGELLSCQLSEFGAQSGNWFKVAATPSWLASNKNKKATSKEKEEEAVKLPGWAHLSCDDEIIDSPETCALIAESVRERSHAIESGVMLDDSISLTVDQRPLVVSIASAECASSQLVGAKAASLAQLTQFSKREQAQELTANFRVPPGVVLTRYAYELILVEQDDKQVMQESLSRLIDALHCVATANAVEAAEVIGERVERGELEVRQRCEELQELVRKQIKLPEKLMSELGASCEREELATGVKVAVRSSSWGEDEGDMSAAGQLTTILNVPIEDEEALKQAVLECYASKFSYENVQYKRQHGLPLDLPMAVVIQAMVGCQKAGVMFTCDPISGNERRLVITANYGLGESVVSAQADPDSIVVSVGASNSLSVSNIHIGSKLVVTKDDNLGNETTTTTNQEDKSKCCLSEEEILRLARVGCQLKRYFQANQQHCDIEFGFIGDQLNLFQCRPVTGLEAMSEFELMHEFNRVGQSELVFYSRANVGEVLPFALRPLSLTSLVNNFSVLSAQMHLDCQPLAGKQKLRLNQIYVPQCTMTDFSTEKYHAFFNLFGSNWLKLGDESEKTTLSRSLEIGMFGRELEPQQDLIEAMSCFEQPASPFIGLNFKLQTLRLRLEPKSYIEAVKKRVEQSYKSLLEQMEAAKGNKFEPIEEKRIERLLNLYNQFKATMRNSFITWKLHIGATLLDSEHHLELNKLLANYIDDPRKLFVASNKFLALTQDVISAEIPARIANIARVVTERCGGKEFLELNNQEALEFLNKQTEFVEFVDKFGHRCYSEFDIAAPTWLDQPARLLEMVRSNCRALTGAKDSTTSEDSNGLHQKLANGTASEETTSKPSSVDEVIASLEGKPLSKVDELKLKHLLVPRCQLYLASRERTKNTLILYVGCVRLAARLLAHEMRLQMRLPDEELMFYVPFDELELLCRNYRPSVVMQALRRRQLFARHFPADEAWKFDEIIRAPELIPNHLKPQLELDEKLKQAPKLVGTPASSGKVRGQIYLIENYQQLARVTPGSILLTHSTDIAFSPVFPLIKGIITEVGGLISHGAVVAREYGLPSVIGIPNVTKILQHGEQVLLDADNGAIIRLSLAE